MDKFPATLLSGQLLRKTLKHTQRSTTCRSSDYAPPLWCGHPKSHLYLSGIRHSQCSCPSPAKARSPIYYFIWAWVGCQVEKDFFSPVVTDEQCISANKQGSIWGHAPQGKLFKLGPNTLSLLLSSCFGQNATRISPPVVSAACEALWSDWTELPAITASICVLVLHSNIAIKNWEEASILSSLLWMHEDLKKSEEVFVII